MNVRDDEVAALRAILTKDAETAARFLSAFEDGNYINGFSALVSLAFVMAARMRFAAGYADADVIRYVARVRAEYDEPDAPIDTRVAEKLLLDALDGNRPADFDPTSTAKGVAQPALLAALVDDAQMDTAELDDFLANARRLADQWLATLPAELTGD